MRKNKKEFRFGFWLVFSCGIHVIAFIALMFNISEHNHRPVVQVSVQPKQEIVQAGLVDHKAVEAAYKRQEIAAQRKRQEALQQQRQTQRLKQEAEKAKKDKELAQQQKQQLDLARKKVEEDKIKLEAEKENAKKEKAKIERDLKMQAEIQQQQAKIKAEKEAKRLKQEQVEKKRLAERETWLQNEVRRYRDEFAGVIEENRVVSTGFSEDALCKIRIRLLPDGSILDLTITQSSGNVAYDSMSETAVYKAAPFQLPEDQELNSMLRDIVLSFRNNHLT